MSHIKKAKNRRTLENGNGTKKETHAAKGQQGPVSETPSQKVAKAEARALLDRRIV